MDWGRAEQVMVMSLDWGKHWGLGRRWRDGANAALGFIYPEICQYCRERWAEPAEGFICSECAALAVPIRPPYCGRCGLPFAGAITGPFECSNCRELELSFSAGRAAVAAEGMVLDLIHRWKYHGALWLEPFFVKLLLREALPAIPAGSRDLVVAVPLHPLREREREFNQALHLARPLAAALGVPVNEGAVARTESTATQTRLTRAERDANMRRAFAAGPTAAGVRGRRVILVDDVLTTGSTTNACARVLREAGAEDVCVWTLARGLLH